MLPDRFNPRVRLRDWLNRPTAAEEADAQSLIVSLDEGIKRATKALPVSSSIPSPSPQQFPRSHSRADP